MKKVVGVIPLYDEDKESIWMLPDYLNVIELCGAIPIILPLSDNKDELTQCYGMCDGILMTGGHDVDPSVYLEERKPECGASCSVRDTMERFLFKKAVEDDKPVLGICRGIQLMNALLGGNLYQDLPSEHPSSVEHHMTKPYDKPIHNVEVIDGTILADLIGAGKYEVNSYHHQAIKTLAKDVTAMAISEDGLVEAISLPSKKFIIGVQWHPEFIYKKDKKSVKLVQAFVDAL